MNIIEITDKKTEKDFLKVPKLLYKKDKNWICPLDIEIENIFDPALNDCFNHGEAKRWILKDENGDLIGRIAAFYDNRKKDLYDYSTGGAGFFECINDQEAANKLFDTAIDWLNKKGLKAMQAPVNFGENYMYWGLLVEGFKQQGYGMPYNFPYYQALFENYGFKNYFEQFSFHKDTRTPWPPRMIQYAQHVESNPDFTFEHFRFKNPDKYVDDFVYAFNTIWSGFHDGYTPLQHSEIKKMIDEARFVLDEEFIWFAYDKGKPAGLVVAFPDINQILKKIKNGKLNILNKLKLFYYRRRAITRIRAFIAGILPEYQQSGLITALFYQLVKVLEKRKRMNEVEFSWVGDYNPKMIKIYGMSGFSRHKRHVTYLKIFDPNAPFRRFTNEFEGKLY
ncbi:MAG: GNAT family N-acetyltransferase [Bacteroidales bacterium]|nr:GNAT family N-acetyltransferase [Bacteroidales bacterium]